MQGFRKALLATVSFILSVAIAIIIIIFPSMVNGSDYNDSKNREQLSGTLDYIFLGASHCMAAFVPNVIDEELGVNSYNLSSSAASMEGKLYLLKKEIDRNNLNTVVIDIAYDTLLRRPENDHARGEPMIVCKLDSISERIKYTVDSVSFFNNDYENFMSIFSRYGVSAWKKIILKEQTNHKNGENGFVPEKSVNVTLTENEIIKRRDIGSLDVNYSEKNIDILCEIIRLCKANKVRPVVLTIPIAESRIWKCDNWSEFTSAISNICEAEDCELYDYNLLKKRHEVFDDTVSFLNETHMSKTGAYAFSKEFSEIEKQVIQGADKKYISSLFYSSYEEMKADSPYMKYYLAHKDDV